MAHQAATDYSYLADRHLGTCLLAVGELRPWTLPAHEPCTATDSDTSQRRHIETPTRALGPVNVVPMDPRWQQTTQDASPAATHRHREQRIERITTRQLRLISGAQLQAAGLSPSGVRSRMARGRLHRLHREIYATHSPPYSRPQQYLAATMACGPGALLSDGPAAVHLGIDDTLLPLPVELTVPGGIGRSRPGIVVHRRAPTDPRDTRNVAGVPSVSADLILIQLAPKLAIGRLERIMVAAESLGFLKRGRLAELIDERRGQPGMRALASLLALRPALTRSEIEHLMVPISAHAGLERPLINHPVRVPGRAVPLIVDCAWPALRMVVEVDSQRFHGDWERAEADRERDQLLALAGWLCHRFVRRRIVEDPRGLGRTAAAPGGGSARPTRHRRDDLGQPELRELLTHRFGHRGHPRSAGGASR